LSNPRQFDRGFLFPQEVSLTLPRSLTDKYRGLFDAKLAARKGIVTGEVEPQGVPSGHSKGVPNFWLRAMQNSRTVSQFIEQRDEQALAYLTDISGELLPGAKGFKLIFSFAPNPFFEEAQLTKAFHMRESMLDEDDEDEDANKDDGAAAQDEDNEVAEQLDQETGVNKIVGCEISWKPTKNLTVEVQTKKGKGARGKKSKPVKKEVPVPSFFRFFETPDLDVNPEDEENMMELLNAVNEEVNVGYFIYEELIPKAFGFFAGEEVEEEDDEDEDGDDEEEDDDDEEDEEEEDE
jgi:nucleosome assembly protein 1-like 1